MSTPGIDKWLRTRTVMTLGPSGTDAYAEASRIGAAVSLCSSFSSAMREAEETDNLALVAAGFLDLDGDRLVDSWVNLHFRTRRSMRVVGVWESPTKPMCVAVRADLDRDVSQVRSVVAHPSTLQLVRETLPPEAEVRTVNAKPKAARAVADGEADACIASLDVVQGMSELRALSVLTPTMVWCLYAPLEAQV
ncbi:hypothetical protein [Micromonospora sp. RV43]|uniref:hypothetical protein n=1 Tax=Micromonospora sp. RV43 TaxID=1661387 RepID=UPI00064BA042|nr:hypothetical protein [Micromonospora sp. RV43]